MTNTCLPVQGYYKNKGSYIEEMLTFYLQMENYLDSKTKLFYYAIKHKRKNWLLFLHIQPCQKLIFIHLRTAYRCEKEATGELNRDTLINYINEIALNTPDAEEKVKYEQGVKRGKVYVPKYTEEQQASMEKTESSQVRLDPEEEEALSNATLNDIMALADILNTNPQDFVMEAYADPLQYFEPDPPNTTNPKEVLEKLQSNDKETKDVCLNNVAGISEQLFCDIFNAIKNNDQLTKLSACNCDVSYNSYF